MDIAAGSKFVTRATTVGSYILGNIASKNKMVDVRIASENYHRFRHLNHRTYYNYCNPFKLIRFALNKVFTNSISILAL